MAPRIARATMARPPASAGQKSAVARASATRSARPVTRSPGPVDGRAFVASALVDIKRRTATGEKVRVVFDIDNTLADTRVRTFAIARAWDQANGTHYFDRLTPAMVGKNARDTALAMDLPLPAMNAFEAHWGQAFWDPANFVHDAPMPQMVALAKAAASAGAQVVFLTGRVQSLEPATIAQLERFGLPADASTVVSKPELATSTVAFKAQTLRSWEKPGSSVGFFLTEGRRDTAGIQAALPGVRCVLLDSSMGGNEPVRPDTPTLPRLF